MRPFLPLLLTVSLAAADAVPPGAGPATAAAATGAAPAGSVSVAAPSGPKPFFGVRIDSNSAVLGDAPGLPVSEVVMASTAQQLGMEVGDRLVKVNGQPVASDDDLRRILGGSKVGDPITVEFTRGGAVQTASGTLQERPRPVSWTQQADEVKRKVDELNRLAEQKRKEPSLTDIIDTLQYIERDLPKAVAAFKQQYPDGEFDIDIRIKVVSDKKAAAPLRLGNTPGSIPGPTPAGSATPASTAGSATPATGVR